MGIQRPGSININGYFVEIKPESAISGGKPTSDKIQSLWNNTKNAPIPPRASSLKNNKD